MRSWNLKSIPSWRKPVRQTAAYCVPRHDPHPALKTLGNLKRFGGREKISRRATLKVASLNFGSGSDRPQSACKSGNAFPRRHGYRALSRAPRPRLSLISSYPSKIARTIESVNPRAIAIAGHVLRMAGDDRREPFRAIRSMGSRIDTSTRAPRTTCFGARPYCNWPSG